MSVKRGLDQGNSPKKRPRFELSNPVQAAPPDPKKAAFEEALRRATPDDVLWEFNFFIKTLSHNMVPQQRNEIVQKVRVSLKVIEAKKEVTKRDVNADPLFSSKSATETPILDALATYLGSSLIYLTPPTRMCIHCRSQFYLIPLYPGSNCAHL